MAPELFTKGKRSVSLPINCKQETIALLIYNWLVALAGGVHSYASELWALGCVMYELSVGRPPFISNSFSDLVRIIQVKLHVIIAD